MVQPSCVQTASIAVTVVAFVREIRNDPAMEFTSAAPPTSASGVPVVVTCTFEFANAPVSAARSIGVLPESEGDDEEDPPLLQAEKTAVSAAAVAAVHAPAQKDRRETFVFTRVSWAISGPAEKSRDFAEAGARALRFRKVDYSVRVRRRTRSRDVRESLSVSAWHTDCDREERRLHVAKPMTQMLSGVDSLFYLATGIVIIAAVAGYFLK